MRAKVTPMKIFLGQIDPMLTPEELRTYLNNYGTLTDLKIISQKNYGFAFFTDPFDPERLLESKEHVIGGRSFLVEKGREPSERRDDRGSYDSYHRSDYMDRGYGRDMDRNYGRDMDYGYGRDMGRGYGRDARPDYDSRSSYGPRRCEYCDRCPIHGRGPREEPIRMVIESLPSGVTNKDIGTFVRARNFDPSYVKVRGDYAFVDFRTESERDDAIKTLNGHPLQIRDYDGNVVQELTANIRPFVNSEQMRRDNPMKRRRMETSFVSNPTRPEDNGNAADIYKDSDEKAAVNVNDAKQ